MLTTLQPLLGGRWGRELWDKVKLNLTSIFESNILAELKYRDVSLTGA